MNAMEIAFNSNKSVNFIKYTQTYKGHSPEPYTTKTDAQSHEVYVNKI